MILIGERINGLFSDIQDALQARDPEPIRRRARLQVEAGARFLDVNTGPGVDDPAEAMTWLVNVVQDEIEVPICVDAAKIPAIEAGLKAHRHGRPLINSTTGERKMLEQILPLAKEYNALVIGLAMNERGVPKDANDRTAIAMEIVAAADEFGLATSDLFIDPLVLPVGVAQEHGPEVLETLRQVKILSDPPPKTVVGLSNVSQKTKHRSLINRTFLAMAMGAGLDAAIMDVEDDDLVSTVAAATIILNEEVYAESFLEVARRKS